MNDISCGAEASCRALVLGGARSGKSEYAEKWLSSSRKEVVCIVTADNPDGEMNDRILLHQQRRLENWRTVEAPYELASAIDEASADNAVLLVDCVSVWLSNRLLRDGIETLPQAMSEVVAAFERFQGTVVIVSNEVGMGLVPEYKLGRQFRDAQGRLNQDLAEVADRVEFVAAGLPLRLK